MHKYNCKTCNKEFEDKKLNRKYCSNKCTAEGNKVKEKSLFKICSTCNIEKSVDEFWKRKDSKKTGCHFECISCGNIRNANKSPEFRARDRLRTRTNTRLKSPYGLDPNFEGKYKPGTKYNPETRFLSKNGYWLIYRPGHPNAQGRTGKYNKGRIFEHIFIMSEYLGRPLKKDETIHHKNGIRHDNRIENLELWKKGQPPGARVEDKLKWAKELLEEYGYKVIKE